MISNNLRQYINRWLFSTNCKDIAILYMIFAIFSGLVGTGLSIIIRLELAGPTPQILEGNGQVFNVVISAHAIFMIFFLVMPMSVGFFGKLRMRGITSQGNALDLSKLDNQVIDDHQPKVADINDSLYYNIEFIKKYGPYLAGLIEGDGTIWVQDESQHGLKQNIIPKIFIVFSSKDIPLAEHLVKLTGCGYIKKEKGNYVNWYIQNFRDVYKITMLINGYMRTPKHEALNRVINWYNNYIIVHRNKDLNNLKGWEVINVPKALTLIEDMELIELKSLDTSPIESNNWLSGMTDADGNFSISLYKKKRINLLYRLELRQNYHRPIKNDENINQSKEILIENDRSYFKIMNAIAVTFNSKVYSRSRVIKFAKTSGIYHSHIVMITKASDLKKVQAYFTKFPLLSSKYLDYKDWSNMVDLIRDNGQSVDIYKKGENIRKDFNKTRSTFSWKHLTNS